MSAPFSDLVRDRKRQKELKDSKKALATLQQERQEKEANLNTLIAEAQTERDRLRKILAEVQVLLLTAGDMKEAIVAERDALRTRCEVGNKLSSALRSAAREAIQCYSFSGVGVSQRVDGGVLLEKLSKLCAAVNGKS